MTKIDDLLKRDSEQIASEQIASQKSTGKVLETSKTQIRKICLSLDCSSGEYDPKNTIAAMKEYIELEQRIIYSEVSFYIFSMSDNKKGDFFSNLDQLLLESQSDGNLDSQILAYILKIYDHIHLASYQLEKLRRDDEELQNIIGRKLEPIQKRFEERVENAYKEIYAQLIALIGIFTALAFLIFGSISALDNIFVNANRMSLLKIGIIASIWGICLVNLIFIFIYFVEKLTKLNVEEKRKYNIVVWTNLVLITILLVCSWSYYVRSRKLTDWIAELEQRNEVSVVIGGFITISMIVAGSVIVICLWNRKKK